MWSVTGISNWEKEKPHFDVLGILHKDVPNNVLKYLINEPDKKSKANYKLAGHIKKEFDYTNIPEFVKNFFTSSISNFSEKLFNDIIFKYSILNKNCQFNLDSLWVNYQKKHEFNPIHNHSGIYSFIVFLKIPYDLKKELRVFDYTNKVTSKGKLLEAEDCNNRTSKLCFIITDRLGDINEHLVSVDKSFEGKMLMFPAKLHHQVYPFYTSNGYRITVSGNINLDVTKIIDD